VTTPPKPKKSRKKPPEPERHRVWVAAGGRCTICGKYLMEGALSKQPFRLGELAHIVGQQDSAKSPRGKAEPLTGPERDKAENLMLLCAGEHQEIDREGALDLFTVAELRRIKAAHEDWIRRVTGIRPDVSTVVVRMLSNVRGRAVELDRATATAAVIRHDGRFPDFPLTFQQDGVEVDLRQLPGEAEAAAEYWTAAVARIDQEVARLTEGIQDGRARHVSVFAIARIPLLVHLGSRLDDAYGVDVFQRHRSTEKWDWPPDATDESFQVSAPADTTAHDEAVLLVNLSGTVQPEELPEALRGLPRFVVAPAAATPHPDIIGTAATLRSFEATARGLLAGIEQDHKQLRRLHLLGAIPVSAAVVLGRVRDPHVHPDYVLYDRGADGYTAVLEIR
jgi:hypothetical protein